MLLAMGTFTIGDTITKYLLTEMNSGQYMLIRGIFATVLIGFLAWRHGALRGLSLEKMTVLRVAGKSSPLSPIFIPLATSRRHSARLSFRLHPSS